MFAVAIAFWRERTVFVDIAFHLYLQATTGEVAVQNFRFVSAATQWLPTVLLRGGVDLPTVQLAYSLVFPALYFGVWAIVRFGLRSPTWALAWALTWLTFATHTYYWIQSELPQGLAALTLALPLVTCTPRAAWARAVLAAATPLLLLVVAFAHPLLIVPVTACFGLLWLERPYWDRFWAVAPAAAVYYMCYWLRAAFFSTSYDAAAGEGWRGGVASVLAGEVPFSVRELIGGLGMEYVAFTLLVALAVFGFWRAGHPLAAAWAVASVAGHLALVALSYPTSQTRAFYIENLYAPAAYVAAAAFSLAWVGGRGERPVPRWVAGLAFASSLARAAVVVAFGTLVYVPRLAALEELLGRHADRKAIARNTPALRDRLIMTWGVPFEAWVLSAGRNLPTQGFLLADDPARYRDQLGRPGIFVGAWTSPEFASLPAAYFRDPGGVYEEIEIAE